MVEELQDGAYAIRLFAFQSHKARPEAADFFFNVLLSHYDFCLQNQSTVLDKSQFCVQGILQIDELCESPIVRFIREGMSRL